MILLQQLIIILSVTFFVTDKNMMVKSESEKTVDDSSALLFIKDVESDANEDAHVEIDDVGKSSNVADMFIPTNEWQEVKNGQIIPAGLHVKMDFETGKKFAKLMGDTKLKEKKPASLSNEKTTSREKVKIVRPEPAWKRRMRERRNMGKDSKTKSWDAGKKIGIINTEKKRYSREELKKALKDFKYNDVPKENSEKEKKKFHTYEELKKAMADSKMSLKTEVELVDELYTRLKKPGIHKEEVVTILIDLEYYLHQIDNARVFADQGGLTTLKKLLNSTEDDIRAGAAHTLGAALQSNSKVQVAALESGLMQMLVKTLSIDASLHVRKKCLFALSTLVRQFPFAQKRLLDVGGLSAMADLFIDTNDETLKLKILTLLTDLLVEYDFNMKQGDSSDSIQVQRTKQYKMMELRPAMLSSGWCRLMTSLLQSLTGHDNVDKLITAMLSMANTCRHAFHPARTQLQSLMLQYSELSKDEQAEGGDDFFTMIYSSLETLLSQIVKDEL